MVPSHPTSAPRDESSRPARDRRQTHAIMVEEHEGENNVSIVVAYKYAPNPQDTKVLADGAIDWSRAKAAVSESDPVAMEMGRRIATAVGTELVGISVGNAQIASPIARKNAMSRGFDRGILLADDVVADWSATQVGAALAELVKKVGDVSLAIDSGFVGG